MSMSIVVAPTYAEIRRWRGTEHVQRYRAISPYRGDAVENIQMSAAKVKSSKCWVDTLWVSKLPLSLPAM